MSEIATHTEDVIEKFSSTEYHGENSFGAGYDWDYKVAGF